MSPNVSFETKVAVIEDAVSRYEDAISKLVDVSQDLKQMIAIHDLKLLERERSEISLKMSIEKENNILHGRISDLSHMTKRDMDEQYRKLMDSLKEMRDEQQAYHKEMRENVEDLRTDLKDQIDDQIEPISKKVAAIERWRWIILGGGLSLYYVLSQIPWQNFIGG